MVIKFVESTYDSFKDKLKNPFYGTLCVVWIIRNREFIYNVFFNPDCTSDERLEILRNQFSWGSIGSFVVTILISLGLMVLIYLSLNLSRLIVQGSEKKLKPFILKFFDKTSVVSREDYLAMESQRDYFQKKHSEERNERIKLQRELDEKVESIVVDGGEIEDSPEIVPIQDLEIDFEKYFGEWSEGQKSSFKKLIGKINDGTQVHHITQSIGKDYSDIFLSKNLIKRIGRTGKFQYEFTEFGKKVRDYFIQNNIN